MPDDRLTLLALTLTAFFLLIVLLQAHLNRAVWRPYLVALLASTIATVMLWPGVGR